VRVHDVAVRIAHQAAHHAGRVAGEIAAEAEAELDSGGAAAQAGERLRVGLRKLDAHLLRGRVLVGLVVQVVAAIDRRREIAHEGAGPAERPEERPARLRTAALVAEDGVEERRDRDDPADDRHGSGDRGGEGIGRAGRERGIAGQAGESRADEVAGGGETPVPNTLAETPPVKVDAPMRPPPNSLAAVSPVPIRPFAAPLSVPWPAEDAWLASAELVAPPVIDAPSERIQRRMKIWIISCSMRFSSSRTLDTREATRPMASASWYQPEILCCDSLIWSRRPSCVSRFALMSRIVAASLPAAKMSSRAFSSNTAFWRSVFDRPRYLSSSCRSFVRSSQCSRSPRGAAVLLRVSSSFWCSSFRNFTCSTCALSCVDVRRLPARISTCMMKLSVLVLILLQLELRVDERLVLQLAVQLLVELRRFLLQATIRLSPRR
jgi:hypothetical protein